MAHREEPKLKLKSKFTPHFSLPIASHSSGAQRQLGRDLPPSPPAAPDGHHPSPVTRGLRREESASSDPREREGQQYSNQ